MSQTDGKTMLWDKDVPLAVRHQCRAPIMREGLVEMPAKMAPPTGPFEKQMT